MTDETESSREVVDLQLGDFDSHGVTRARYRGRWIEVEHGIPDERARVEIFGGTRPRGRILEVLEPSPDRVEPPCRYFRDWACGGCQWQQIDYTGQLFRKREAIDAVMDGAGLDIRVSAVNRLDDPWRYRTTAGISLGKSAGFRRHGSLAIVPIHDCPISHPAIGRLMAALNDHLDEGTLPNFRGRIRLEVRLTGLVAGEEHLLVLVRPDRERLPPAEEIQALVAVLTAAAEVTGVSVVRRTGDIDTISGPLLAPTLVAGRPVYLSAASFFQTNLRLLPQLIDGLRISAQPLKGKRVADVYGGVGLLGLFLADEAEEVVIVESDALAIEAGERTAAEWGRSNIRFLRGRAEEILPDAGSFDVVIVDPPRTGLTETVVEILARDRPSLLLYVSCLAQSLARDLVALREAYRPDGLELFDFYPQTYHVELLARAHAL
ncbi:MAG TPA: 23S rRNA (uracil(1939)-C(5))-methyltransferase RlmD [Chloroflexota bacterium]|nr:23S rRNA (uracil(1939)-C(5))-methyltransferase RlmD [Chloroflexota bacterium]